MHRFDCDEAMVDPSTKGKLKIYYAWQEISPFNLI